MNHAAKEEIAWRLVSPISIGYFIGAQVKAILKQSINLFSTLGALSVVLVTIGISIPVAITIAISGVLAVIVISSILSYLCFRIRLSSESIAVKSGIIRKSQVDVQWDRVRAVNINRGPADRVFGLSTVSLDTAGTAEAEVVIPGLSFDLAHELSNKINAKLTNIETISALPESERDSSTTIHTVEFKDLLRASFCSRGTVVMAALCVAFGFSLLGNWFQWQSERWEEDIETRLEQDGVVPLAEIPPDPTNNFLDEFFGPIGETVSAPIHFLLLSMLVGIGIVLLVFLPVLIVIFVVQALIIMEKYHKLEVTSDGDTLNSSHGLVTKRRVGVEQRRVQTITYLMNLRERWSKCGTMEFVQSESDEMHKLRIPGVRLDDGLRLVELVHDHAMGTPPLHPKSPEISKVSLIFLMQLLAFYVGLPGLVALVVLCFIAFTWVVVLSITLILILGFILAYFQWSKAGYSLGNNHIVIRSGVVGYKVQLARLEKVQSVEILQNVVQTLTGRSTFRLEFSTGNLDIPFVAIDTAKELRDFVLDRIEKQNVRWI